MKRILLIICLVVGTQGLKMAVKGCPCQTALECKHATDDLAYGGELYVFHNGLTDIRKWRWDTITTLIVPDSFDIKNGTHASTMCLAHKKGRKFGITVDMDLTGGINETSVEAKQWITSVTTKQNDWHADVLVINLVKYFKQDTASFSKDHISLIRIIAGVRAAIKNQTGISVQVSCITPWKPPCAEADQSCDFSEHSQHACDFYILNAESFTDVSRTKCRAQATIPFSKLLYGIGEYNSHHIPNSRIILSVPWHGYDYTCQEYVNGICSLKETKGNSASTCHFDDRRTMSFAEIYNHTKAHEADKDDLYNAPHFTYKVGDVTHEVWFENHQSLLSKYRLVHGLNLRGIGIMYGDDLTSDTTPKPVFSDEPRWSWVAHTFILSASQSTVSNPFHYADMVTGIGIGCLILGALLGVIFTCIALRNRVKKPKQPFYRDLETNTDQLTDEDPNL